MNFFVRNENSIFSPKLFILSLFIAFSILITIDIYSVYFSGVQFHQYLKWVEFAIFSIGLTAFIYILKNAEFERKLKHRYESEILKIKEENKDLQSRLHSFKADFETLIHSHFSVWNLTDAEKVVGLCLLQGLGMKEISEMRNVSERTIRNQCHSIYSKAELTGKHELAAYFLKELLTT